jgi:hypothetical protein
VPFAFYSLEVEVAVLKGVEVVLERVEVEVEVAAELQVLMQQIFSLYPRGAQRLVLLVLLL